MKCPFCRKSLLDSKADRDLTPNLLLHGPGDCIWLETVLRKQQWEQLDRLVSERKGKRVVEEPGIF